MPRVGAKDRRIAALEHEFAQTQQELAEARQELAKAFREIEQLKALVLQLCMTSRNSSTPPSANPPGAPRPDNKRTGRKRGGQPGKVVPIIPERCGSCGGKLLGQDPSPSRHQQVEVPPITPQVTEYLCHALECWGCGHVTRDEVPLETRSAFGARLCAITSLCTGKYRLSKRLIQELLSDLLGVELALGPVSNIERRWGHAAVWVNATPGAWLVWHPRVRRLFPGRTHVPQVNENNTNNLLPTYSLNTCIHLLAVPHSEAARNPPGKTALYPSR